MQKIDIYICRGERKQQKKLDIHIKGHEIVEMNPCPKDAFVWSKKTQEHQN